MKNEILNELIKNANTMGVGEVKWENNLIKINNEVIMNTEGYNLLYCVYVLTNELKERGAFY